MLFKSPDTTSMGSSGQEHGRSIPFAAFAAPHHIGLIGQQLGANGCVTAEFIEAFDPQQTKMGLAFDSLHVNDPKLTSAMELCGVFLGSRVLIHVKIFVRADWYSG